MTMMSQKGFVDRCKKFNYLVLLISWFNNDETYWLIKSGYFVTDPCLSCVEKKWIITDSISM